MATTGSVDINLTPIGNIVNNTTDVGAEVTEGISDQGDLIGLAIGITIAILMLVGAITAVLGIIFVIFTFVRKLMNVKLK